MVALESSLSSNTKRPTIRATEGFTSLPSVFRAIEYNLHPNYRRHHDNQHGHYWIYRVPKTNLSAHIFPKLDHDIISICILDDRKNPGEIIKKWSCDLRMTGKWWRRLRRTAGEAIVLANQRPRCPNCRKPLILRERRTDHQQFFGCEDYPSCNGSISIIDHDIDRKKAVAGVHRPTKPRRPDFQPFR